MIVSPDRIRSEELCLHYRFMRDVFCPPVLGTEDNCRSRVGKKGAQFRTIKAPHFLVTYPWRIVMRLGWSEPWRCP